MQSPIALLSVAWMQSGVAGEVHQPSLAESGIGELIRRLHLTLPSLPSWTRRRKCLFDRPNGRPELISPSPESLRLGEAAAESPRSVASD